MSNVPCANIVVVPSANEPEQVEKKARAPSLPAKFGKFIQFAYYLIQQNNAAQDFAATVDDEPASLEHIFKLYASIDDQQAFVQAFLDQSKEINQKIRQEILQRKRADAKAAKAEARALAKANKPPKEPKAPKEKQPRQKKEKVSATTGEVSEAASSSESESETKEKKARGRKPKAKVLSSQDAFVNEMVQLANGDEPAPPAAVALETAAPAAVESAKPEKKVKKESKTPKAEKESKAPKAEKESKAPKASKKTKAEKESEHPESNETAVSVLNLNGQNYLLDDNLAVYHFQTHDLLGQFHPTTQTITFS
jgi:hypothetical protein